MSQLMPPRDSLELASLASSNHETHQESVESSSEGISSSRKLSFAEASPRLLNGNRRSHSVSSAFEFNSTLFPLSTSAGGYSALGSSQQVEASQNLEKHKSLTYLNGLSLVVGLVIGSGIFSSPASVSNNVGSIGASLIVWFVAGCLAWTGAASYAELGGAIPLNGGAQVYLSKIFAEWVGFLYTWCAVMILKPGSAAIVAITFGDYIIQAATGNDAITTFWLSKVIAVSSLVVVTFINCVSTKLGTRSADFLIMLKFVTVLAVSVAGIVVAISQKAYHAEQLSTAWRNTSWFRGTSMSSSQWAVALYAGLWAYDGWDNINFVVGEMVNPARDLPRTIHTALPVVIISYMLTNLSYIFVLPPSVINSSTTVAVAFGSTVSGPVGALLLSLAVAGSCFGALNASTFTSGRLVYAAGREGYIPAFFGMTGLRGITNSRTKRNRSRFSRWISDETGLFNTPIYAMVLNAVMTTIYVVVGDFTSLTTFYGISSYLFYFLAVVGLIVLRVKEPELERPYRCWLMTPIIFCCVSLFLLSRTIFARPLQALIVLAFLMTGLPVYWWQLGRRGQKAPSNDPRWWQFWHRSTRQ